MCLGLLPDTESITEMLFELEYALHPGRGRSVIRYSAEGSATDDECQYSVDDLAAVLANTELDTGQNDDISAALSRAVEAATYWGEPDGADVLAADPRMRSALERVADALVDRPDTASWWHGVADPQWLISLDEEVPEGAGLALPRDLASWRRDQLEAEAQAKRYYRRPRKRMLHGEWWSVPPRAERKTYGRGLPGALDLMEDSFGWTAARAERVEAPRSVLEIREADDWVKLCREFPLDVSFSMRGPWGETTGRIGRWVIPDWAAVAEHHASVHLPVASWLTLAGTPIPMDDGFATMIAGFDPDSTVWLGELPRPVDSTSEICAPEIWERDDDQSPWRRV